MPTFTQEPTSIRDLRVSKQTNLQNQQKPNVGIADHAHLWEG